MEVYPISQVDAFTETPLSGNPCAVVFDSDRLDTRTMQAIALEMNLSETAFVRRSSKCDFGVRYFTPSEEIPLAGHPTIATVQALIDTQRLALSQAETTTLTFELQVGPIQIEVYHPQNKVEKIEMTQKKPVFLNTYPAADILPVFGLSIEDVVPHLPIQTVSTGTPQLMIPIKDLPALKKAHLNIPLYAALRSSADFFSPHLFCLTGVTSQGQTFARHFGTPPDTLEDPFTGSATGGMGAYLWHYNLIDKPAFVAEQGHWMNRPGKGFVEIVGPRENIEAVKVGGCAVTVFTGVLTI